MAERGICSSISRDVSLARLPGKRVRPTTLEKESGTDYSSQRQRQRSEGGDLVLGRLEFVRLDSGVCACPSGLSLLLRWAGHRNMGKRGRWSSAARSGNGLRPDTKAGEAQVLRY